MPPIEPEPNSSAAPPLSVFVDDSGTKRRRARRAGRLLALGLVAYALVLLTGLVRPVPFPDADVPPPGEGDLPPRGQVPSAQQVLLGPAPGPVVRAAAAPGAPVIVDATEPTATTSPVVIEPAPLPTAPPTPMWVAVPPTAQPADEPAESTTGPFWLGPR